MGLSVSQIGIQTVPFRVGVSFVSPKDGPEGDSSPPVTALSSQLLRRVAAAVVAAQRVGLESIIGGRPLSALERRIVDSFSSEEWQAIAREVNELEAWFD
jgi:hypothetical protein